MQADPLQHLRDIHLPADPSWWPPAPGWWLLTALAIALSVWLWRFIQQLRHRRAPFGAALRLYEAEYARFGSGNSEATEFVNRTNEIIKRTLIHLRHDQRAVRASDDAWLTLLDELSGTTDFSRGPGSVLGSQRFAPALSFDEHGFDRCIRTLLRSLKS